MISTAHRVGIFMIVSALPSCTTVQQKLSEEVYYERDLYFEVNSLESEKGILVAPLAEQYEIEVTSRKKHDAIYMTSCARRDKAESQGKKYKYTYVPLKRSEKDPDCVMHIASLSKKGKHGWGFIAFEDPTVYTLKALLECNGKESQTSGVSVCQTQEGILQTLVFSERVLVESSDRCKIQPDSGEVFEFQTRNRECVYNFLGAVSETEHIHFAIGYEKSLIRDM